ncbi:MAG TPA: heavy-metal-associated domain-containing protein [Bacteroidota bacterium]|nr:heavy-metal-associated domain-containing protein [Bacteroidota bacterium]
MKEYNLSIEGMSCNHCVMHVKKALSTVEGVEVESVEIGKARVWFDPEKVAQKTFADAIEEAGYKLVAVQ